MNAHAPPAMTPADERNDEQQRESELRPVEGHARRRGGTDVQLALGADVPEAGAECDRGPESGKETRQRLHDRRADRERGADRGGRHLVEGADGVGADERESDSDRDEREEDREERDADPGGARPREEASHQPLRQPASSALGAGTFTRRRRP